MKRIICLVATISCVAVFGSVTMRAASAADWDRKIENVDGTPLKDDKGKEVDLTVRTVAVNALMAPYQDEPNLSGEEKVRRADLARRILTKDPSSDVLSSEDIALIKKLVNKFYPSPLVVSQAWKALETPTLTKSNLPPGGGTSVTVPTHGKK